MSKRKPRQSRADRKRDEARDIAEWRKEWQWLIELWGVHQVLRSVGFAASEIFVGFGHVLNVAPDTVFVSLQAQGKEFIYHVAQLPGCQEDDVYARWTAFAEEMNAADPERLKLVYRASRLGSDINLFAELLAVLAKKGFHIEKISPEVAETLASIAPEPPPLKHEGEA